MRVLYKSRTAWVLVVAVLLIGFAADRAWVWRSRVEAQHERDRAVSAASLEVKRLITISGETSTAALRAVLAGATSSFRSDIQNDAKQLQQLLSAQNVIATGSVVAAGIGPSNDDSATVYVAARGTVTNRGTSSPQPRDYRVKVTMQKVGARWLVAGLVFVP